MNDFFCHKVLPATFDDSLSYYEVVCKLTEKINEIGDVYNQLESTMQELSAEVCGMQTHVDELDSRVEEYNARLLRLISELYDMVAMLKESELQYDPQHGFYTDTQTAQRDMFNDLTVHGITCEDLAESMITVDELSNSGLNVRGLAVLGLQLVEDFDIPKYFKYAENG